MFASQITQTEYGDAEESVVIHVSFSKSVRPTRPYQNREPGNQLSTGE